ncbi:hypothetical protein IFM89_036704 [Coptis chinensis]|uniref:Uncharacterized protein n=1 Tax=Coptis chinensis TaxID=261450 RepID=A0A835M397_9MAGN|nr:hypothetical protein IFM89_036704 [Coptis chinensis]
MGSCFSKKKTTIKPTAPLSNLNPIPKVKSLEENIRNNAIPAAEETAVRKEIFVIKQRKSHDREENRSNVINKPTASPTASSSSANNEGAAKAAAPIVRTSSCTKEEVDAILIQCGRLSRSSSGKAAAAGSSNGRKYSGSKRSYDFDQESKKCTDEEVENEQEVEDGQRARSSHRRTLSREKDVEYKRSGSRHRHRSSSTSREEEKKRNSNGGSTSRRLSRSPGRRSETPTTMATTSDKSKPGKMVSVPASNGAIKRVSVKRATASPRSQSPANARASNEQLVPQPSLSRNSSRKADQSPYRRNPLSEIDDNCLRSEQGAALKRPDHQIKKTNLTNNKAQCNKEVEEGIAAKKPFHFQSQKPDEVNIGGATKEKYDSKNPKNLTEGEVPILSTEIEVTENIIRPAQTITRSRSSRRSRDLDFLNNGNEEKTFVNNVPTSYASLLLEDIQNFHQKNTNNNTSTFTLPPCVTKACSILDAVADLNSSTTSNITSGAFSNDRSDHPSHNFSSTKAQLEKKRLEVVNKDPLFETETEVFMNNDLLEPSIHKYITVRRGMTGGEEMEQQESSGSNSVVCQQWFSSSSWEPNSADSTDQWTSSSNTGNEVVVEKEEPRKKMPSERARRLRNSGRGKKIELDQHHQIGKVGIRNHTTPVAAAASV